MSLSNHVPQKLHWIFLNGDCFVGRHKWKCGGRKQIRKSACYTFVYLTKGPTTFNSGDVLPRLCTTSCPCKLMYTKICTSSIVGLCRLQRLLKESLKRIPKKPNSEKIEAFQQEFLGKMQSPLVFDRLHVLAEIFFQNSFQEYSIYSTVSVGHGVKGRWDG